MKFFQTTPFRRFLIISTITNWLNPIRRVKLVLALVEAIVKPEYSLDSATQLSLNIASSVSFIRKTLQIGNRIRRLDRLSNPNGV